MNGVYHNGYYASEGEILERGTLEKIHTIRANYELWAKRIQEVQAGEAIISLRNWTGKPYKSKQLEFMQLAAEDGIGIQKLIKFEGGTGWGATHIEDGKLPIYCCLDFCHHDGLNQRDFIDWFKPYKMDKPLAIIHFTKYRY